MRRAKQVREKAARQGRSLASRSLEAARAARAAAARRRPCPPPSPRFYTRGQRGHEGGEGGEGGEGSEGNEAARAARRQGGEAASLPSAFASRLHPSLSQQLLHWSSSPRASSPPFDTSVGPTWSLGRELTDRLGGSHSTSLMYWGVVT